MAGQGVYPVNGFPRITVASTGTKDPLHADQQALTTYGIQLGPLSVAWNLSIYSWLDSYYPANKLEIQD